MKKFLLALFAILMSLSLSCASRGPEPSAETTTPDQAAAEPAGISDVEIGLAVGSAFDQPAQTPIGFNTVDPGESEIQARPNSEFPPVIPHSIEDMETIGRSENPCMDCHEPEAAQYSDAPALPASHEVDLRRAPDTQGDEVAGARWVCTSCHVARTDAKPLVGNSAS